jgi:hypothetical protein
MSVNSCHSLRLPVEMLGLHIHKKGRKRRQEETITNTISCCWTKLQFCLLKHKPAGGAGWTGFDFLHGENICFFFATSRPSFGSIQHTVQWVRMLFLWRNAAGAWIWQPFNPTYCRRLRMYGALLQPLCLSCYGLLRTRTDLLSFLYDLKFYDRRVRKMVYAWVHKS